MTDARRSELKAFLRARRAAASPEASGIPRGKRRLTPGLRREEVAALAGVGVTWYTWLEQGRDINVSADTLQRIARALTLSRADESYLFVLAGLPVGAPDARDATDEWHDTLPPATQLVLDGFTAGPAIALGPTMDVLAYNPLADLVFSLSGSLQSKETPFARNHLWRAFLDPERRHLYATWETSMRSFTGLFRLCSAPYVGHPRYESLLAALREDADFCRIWETREARPATARDLALRHPTLGAISVCSVRLSLDGFAGLLFLLPPADAATARTFLAQSAPCAP